MVTIATMGKFYRTIKKEAIPAMAVSAGRRKPSIRVERVSFEKKKKKEVQVLGVEELDK